jgi:hypothetical protein
VAVGAGAYDNLTPISRIGQAFIASPTEAPDTACLAELAPRWVLPPMDEAWDGNQATPHP